MLAIIEANTKYDYVLIPSDVFILNQLKNLQIPFILCYPDISLKDHYKERYIKRGNSTNFLDVFIEQWDERIQSLMDFEGVPQVVLQKNEYLSTIKRKIDDISKKCDCSYTNQQLYNILKLKDQLNDVGNYGWIEIYCGVQRIYIHFDVKDIKQCNLIFKIGKVCYEKKIDIPLSLLHNPMSYITINEENVRVIDNAVEMKEFLIQLEEL